MSCPSGLLLMGEVWVDKDTPVSTTLEPVFPLGLLLKWGTNLGHIKGLFREGGDAQGTFFWAVVCFNSAQGVASFSPRKS